MPTYDNLIRAPTLPISCCPKQQPQRPGIYLLDCSLCAGPFWGALCLCALFQLPPNYYVHYPKLLATVQDLFGVPTYDNLVRAPTLPGGSFPLIPLDNPTSAFVQDLLTKVRVCKCACACVSAGQSYLTLVQDLLTKGRVCVCVSVFVR